MEIKIQVPNPDDYQGNQLEWFKQLRTVIRSAEKIYQQEISNLTEENYSNVWVDFVIDSKVVEEKEKEGSLNVFIEDRDYFNHLSIRVASV